MRYPRQDENGNYYTVEIDTENNTATEITFPPPGEIIRQRDLDEIDLYHLDQFIEMKNNSDIEDQKASNALQKNLISPVEIIAGAIAAIAQVDPTIAALPEVAQVVALVEDTNPPQ